MNFPKQSQSYSVRSEVAYDQGLRAYMLKIYNYMASGLLLTGIVAWMASESPAVIGALYRVNEAGMIAGMSGLGWVVALAPLGFVLFLGTRLQHMSMGAAQIAFWGFATVMGLSLTSLLLTYTGESVARTFFITAATFGAMSLYGYTTKKDLTSMGSFLFIGLIGVIIASLVNIFLQSSAMAFAISVIGVVVFVGLTAYDTQRLKNLYYQIGGDSAALGKAAIMGALQLYLDFINLFIMLMQFLGDRR